MFELNSGITTINRFVSMGEQRYFGGELKAHIEVEVRKLASLPRSELETVLAPYLEPMRQTFKQIQTVRNAWFTWIEENREPCCALAKRSTKWQRG